MNNNDIVISILACSGYLMYATGVLWLVIILAALQFIAIALDFYHIWIRCQERKERLEKIIARQKNRTDSYDRIT